MNLNATKEVERFEIYRPPVMAITVNTSNIQFLKEKLISISFKNIGGTNATVNGAILNAGDPMLTFSGEKGVYDCTNYAIRFDPVGTNPYVEVYLTFEKRSFIEEIEVPFVKKAK